MGYGYPVVLRQKAVAAYQSGQGSIDDIAIIFGIGSATLKRWLWRKRDHDTLAPRPYGGGNKRKLSDQDVEWMASVLPARADWTILEWRDALENERGVTVSRSAISRVMIKMGWRLKKNP